MLRSLPDLPDGVLGFEAVGEVHSDDYRDTLRPAVDAAAAAGPVRLVYVLGPEFTGYSVGASWQDTKLGLGHLSAFERTAVVADVDWVEHLVSGFAWLVPGELRRFGLDERDEAIRWTAGIEPEPSVEPLAESQPEPVAEDPIETGPMVAVTEPEVADLGDERAEVSLPAPDDAVRVAPDTFGAVTEPAAADPVAAQPAATESPIASVTAPQAPPVPEQWAPDPSGRHQHRWWNGREWTEHVADNGVSGLDPLG